MSLTSCLRKAGSALNAKDKAAVLEAARKYRAQGMSAEAAGIKAIEDRLAEVQAMMVEAQKPKAAPAEPEVTSSRQPLSEAEQSELDRMLGLNASVGFKDMGSHWMAEATGNSLTTPVRARGTNKDAARRNLLQAVRQAREEQQGAAASSPAPAPAEANDVTAKIQRAKRRLSDTRRAMEVTGVREEIAALKAREAEIEREIRALRASAFDDPSSPAPAPSVNTIFTEDAAAAARARLKAKLGRVQSGLDPETIMDGITLAGYHIEKGARTFAAYARAMVDDLGDAVKPYLQSWYMAVRSDPRAAAFKSEMDRASTVEDIDVDQVLASQEQNAPQEADDGNGARELDRPGQRALEGAPADPVQAPDAGRDAGRSPEGSRGADGGRSGGPEGAGGSDGGMGDGAGALPVSGRGAGRKPRGESKPRAGRNARPDADPGLFGDGAGPDPQELTAPNVAPPAPPAFTPTDFEITDDLALGEGGQKAKYRGNVEAIRLLRDLEATGRTATQAEQRVLARYVGWGGIAQAFDGGNKDWAREYAELKDLLTPEEWATAKESTQYAHYTSREIIGGIYEALARMGFTGGKILEPGSGVGNFVGLMPAGLRTSSRFTGVEREAIAVGIAKQLYPLQNIQRADFTEFIGNDGYFDLAIGNPPFARNPLTDKSGRKHLTGLSVHNYFFAKAVDMLREGGILAQVVSNSFMDAKRDTARKYIADRTEFLGAIRLPNNAFAKNANTEVTTDIVFLRKLPESEWGSRSGKENRDRWLDTVNIPDPNGGDPIPVNRYFAENPEMMLGRMGRFGTMYGPGQPALVAKPGQDTAALLKSAIARLPANVYTAAATANTAAVNDAAIVALKNPQVQEGGHYVEGDKLYQRLQDIAGEARAVELTPATMWTEKTRLGEEGYARIKALAGLRKTLRDLLAAELADSKVIALLRKRLNEEYDAYVKKHGLINDRPSARVFDDDPDYPLLASLEHGFTPGITLAAAKKMGVKPMPATAKKGPIFSARVIEKRTAPSRAESPADALNISMAERGRIDAGYIGTLLGRDGEEALREMSTGDKPLLFLDPASNEYVLRDAYLSGNVRAKLAQARQAGMMNNARALEEVQPPDVSAGEISVRVGSPWVPTGIYEEFARHLFGEQTKAKFNYVKANSSYMATISSGSDVADSSTWGTTDYPGTQILTSLMNNREIKVMFKDADGNLKVDKEATDAANQKATEIKQAFSDWAFADSDRADVLAKAYNEANNNYVTRAFDGGYMQFPGKVPDSIIKFRRHQRNAIARIVQDRTALLDHVVGAGKTFTVISAAMELKRTGLANKPLIIVPNHLVKQWASDFYRLYPGANILTATKKDFEKTNRRRFLAKIATGNWDAVIMAHSSFGFIKPAPEFEAQFNEKQVENVMATIQAVEDSDSDDGTKKRTVKQLAALKERLENRIDALRQKPIDALLDFKELGVDQLFVDEAHLFKNLMFTTKMQNVRGLGDSAGSQRAYDLFIKANQLFAQNGRGQGVVFATGTPVSNSLAEMYHMMRYLMPQALQDGGFESFDAWANTFASVEQVWMQKISADGFKADNRMSNFVNTHELLKMFDQVADTVTMDDIKRAYAEENDGAEFPLPRLKNGRRQPVSLVKSEAQDAYMQAIAARAAAIEGKRTNEKGMDNALKIMGDARKAAMDIRLVDMNRTERDKGGRIDRAAEEIHARYRQYDDVKGTQLVFSDLGTPIKHAKAEMKEWEALQARIDKGVDPETVTAANLGNETAMGLVDDAEDAQREMDEKGADWLDAVKAALRGFSVYDDLRAALVERGIPEAEIAFIHDYNTDEQKLSLFRKVNAGDIRVLIGSTPKLGAGTNVQERLVALHHLDVPWKPSDVEQREGRIIRQGNKLMGTLPGFEVEILAYVTQDTLDMRMWQVQETKLRMINQLRTRQIGREIDNAFEDMEMSAGEMQAAATGNMDLLKEIQLRTDVKKLEQAKRSFDAQRNDLASRKKRAEEAVAALPAKIARAEKMAEASKAYTEEQKAQAAAFKVEINGKTYTDPREAGAVLQGFVDAKQWKKKGTDQVLTPEQYEALSEEEQKASDPQEGPLWRVGPVPLKVEMDGKTYTARAALGEAFADTRGDANDPPMWKVDGQTFIRRTKAAAAIAQRVADAIADSSAVEVGKIGPFTVTVEGQGENRYYQNSVGMEVVIRAPGGVEASTTLNVTAGSSEDDARKAATSVINAAMSLASGGEMQARWLREDLSRQKKVLADLATAKTLGEFPQQAKLEEARAAHREVLARLAAKPEQDKPDGEAAQFSRARPTVTVEQDENGRPVMIGSGVRLEFPLPTERLEVIEQPGEEVLHYPIMAAGEFDVLGHVVLLVKDGQPASLIDIEVYGKGQGVGRAAIETLLAAYPDADINISNIVPSARGFWEKMGVPQQNVEGAYDGTLNWETYQAAAGDRAGTGEVAEDGRGSGAQPFARGEGRGRGTAAAAPRAGKRLTRDRLADMVSRITANWANAPDIVVVESMQDALVPEEVRREDQLQRSRGASGEPEGFFYKGKVYLVGAGLRTEADAVRVLFHETLGHAGLRGVFGAELGKVLDLIAAGRAADMQEMARLYGKDLSKPAERRYVAEEVLAMLAQTRPDMSLVQRAIAAIRNFLRRLGLRMELTDADVVANFILPARRWIERGGKQREAGVAAQFSRSQGADIDRAWRDLIGSHKFSDFDTAAATQVDGTPDDFVLSRQQGDQWAALNAREYTRDDGTTVLTSSLEVGQKGFPKGTGAATTMYLQALHIAKKRGLGWMSEGIRSDAARAIYKRLTEGGVPFKEENGASYVTAADLAKVDLEAVAEKIADGRPRPQFSRSIPDTLRERMNDAHAIRLPAGYLLGDLMKSSGKVSWWHKTVGTMHDLAQREPLFKPVYDRVQMFLNDVSFYASEAANAAENLLPRLETLADIGKSPLSAEDTQKISAPVFQGTLAWTRDEQGRPIKVETAEQRAQSMTAQQKAQALVQTGALSPSVLSMWEGLPTEQFEANVASRYESQMLRGGVVWTDTELQSIFGLDKRQIGLYREFRAAVDKSLTHMAASDMLRLAGADGQAITERVMQATSVEDAAQVLVQALEDAIENQPDREDVLRDTAARVLEKAKTVRDLMARGYAPLMRFGRYTVDVTDADGERLYFGLFETEREANKMARDLRAEFPKATLKQGTLSEQQFKMFAGITPETAELFGNMLGLESTGDAAADRAFQEWLKLAKANRSAMKRLIQRKGIAGFSEDAGRVLASFVYSNARQTAKNLHFGAMSQAVMDISDEKGQGELLDAAVELHQYVSNPVEEAAGVRGLLFAQFLGGSVAAALVNMTQPVMVTAPYLSQWGGVAKAARRMTKALSDTVAWETGRKTTGDARLDAAIKQAEEDGTISPQEIYQLMAQAGGTGALQAGDGTTAGDLRAKAANAMSKLMLAWGKPFSAAEQFNRRATFIAAYRTAVEEGIEDPGAFAKRAINDTQFVYNKGNRPAWARGAIGATLFTFKIYSISYVELMGRLIKKGPEGRRAALVALGTLVLMSGLQGLPGAEDLDDLIDGLAQRLGYNWSSKQAKREALQAAFGDELAQFLLSGVSGLPGAPIDVSNRLGMGNLIPGTGLFTKKADYNRDLLEILGPVGSLAQQYGTAVGKMAAGEPVAAAQAALPVAAQNLVKAVDMLAMGMYRDDRGRKVLDTDTTDAVFKAIGFQPRDVAKVQEASFEQTRQIAVNKLRETEIADKWARGIFEKDADKVREAREELRQWNEDNPDSPIRVETSQVLRRVKQMRMSREDRVAATAPSEIRAAVRRELEESR